VRVLRAGEHAQLGQHLGGDAVLREHSLDGVHDHELGALGAHLGHAAVALAPDEAGEGHVLVLLLLLAREDDLLGVQDDDVVARVDVRRVGRLVAAADDVGQLDGEAAQHLPFGINEIPFGLHCLLLREIRLHGKRGLDH
jgi:hypothetical protein